MKLRPPDSSLADYVARRRVFVQGLQGLQPDVRRARINDWLKKNSPFSESEKLDNLLRALSEDERRELDE